MKEIIELIINLGLVVILLILIYIIILFIILGIKNIKKEVSSVKKNKKK